MAFDADTGTVVWEYKFNVWHTDVVEDQLGLGTNMVGDPETGNVYAQTTAGEFVGFSKGGKILWKRSLTEEFGRVSGYGGRITSAVVDEDKVIIGMLNGSWGEQTVGGTTRFVALDKKTGEVIWWGSGSYRVKDTYYSVPIVAVIKGNGWSSRAAAMAASTLSRFAPASRCGATSWRTATAPSTARRSSRAIRSGSATVRRMSATARKGESSASTVARSRQASPNSCGSATASR